MFDPTDIPLFTKYLESMIADDALRERIGGLQYDAVAQYDIELVGKRWLQIYADAIADCTEKQKP